MAKAYREIDNEVQEKPGEDSLTKTRETHSNKSEVTVRLIEHILNLPTGTQRNLLKDLEKKHIKIDKADSTEPEKPFKEMRKHPRKTSLIATDCTTNEVCFINFIKDISNGGVFIETNAPFYIGQKIKMKFSLPQVDDTIVVGGEVIRVDSLGIGVKFIEGDIHKLDLKV